MSRSEANAMLDALGLDKKDAEGYRLRSDGKGRLRLEIQTIVGHSSSSRRLRNDSGTMEEDRHPA